MTKCFILHFRYAIIYQKGYQDFDTVRGAVTTKVKGIAETKNLFSSNSSRIWDVNDYVVPPQVCCMSLLSRFVPFKDAAMYSMTVCLNMYMCILIPL